MQRPDPDRLRALLDDLRVWARDIPVQGSDRYGAMCAGLADDPERASLILLARPGFQNPLILLAAVHHLLLEGERHPLAAYYATLVGDAARPADEGLYPVFAEFVDAHRARLTDLVVARTTQTNEARRTVVTLPAFGIVAQAAGAPLALLEVGASAGLNLLVDRYAFRIGATPAGSQGSSARFACDVEGELRPPVPPRVDIAWRLGLDLNPLDVRDPETRAWLRALVWPEHPDRLAMLDAALDVARPDPPLVLRGDLVDDLASLSALAPTGAALTVVATWTLAYLEAKRRRAFVARLAEVAASDRRSVWLVAGEAESVLASLEVGLGQMPADGFGPSTLSLHRFDPDGRHEHVLLAHAHPHGRWIRWLDAATAAGATADQPA
jgi:hypothetical protein